MKTILALLGSAGLFTGSALAQQYSVDWHKIAGGSRIIDLPPSGAPLTNFRFFFRRV